MNKIYSKTTRQVKKQNTKTVWVTEKIEREHITDEQYENITNNETISFFRRLGGIETIKRGYTVRGYNITKITSTSPCRTIKIIREFKFN